MTTMTLTERAEFYYQKMIERGEIISSQEREIARLHKENADLRRREQFARSVAEERVGRPLKQKIAALEATNAEQAVEIERLRARLTPTRRMAPPIELPDDDEPEFSAAPTSERPDSAERGKYRVWSVVNAKQTDEAKAKLSAIRERLKLSLQPDSSYLPKEALADCLDVIEGGELWLTSPQYKKLTAAPDDYECEVCGNCGNAVGRVFHVEERTWRQIAPNREHGTGVLCMRCAEDAAPRTIWWYGCEEHATVARLIEEDRKNYEENYGNS